MEDVLRSCCAGLDIHQKVIVACVIRSIDGKKRPEKFFASFDTTTRGLFELSDWLVSYDVTHISMESTGVYWKCVWRILQNHFELQLISYIKSEINELLRSQSKVDASFYFKHH